MKFVRMKNKKGKVKNFFQWHVLD